MCVKLLDALLLHSVMQLVDKSTRGKTYLDLVFCSQLLLHDSVLCLPPIGTSDHNCLSFNIFTDRFISVCYNIGQLIFDFGNADWVNFSNWLSSVYWENLYEVSDVGVDMFMSVVEQGLSMFVPLKHCEPCTDPPQGSCSLRRRDYGRGDITHTV
jgi:hypothetical protein